LNKQGFAAAALHGDMHQGARNRTLQALRRGGVRVLVATDVAARGIDVQGISHVINYDLPRQAEDYVHRIGRTGRAGRSGVAISLASVRERFQLKQIERYTAQRIPVATIAGLEPAHRVPQRAAQHRTGSPPRSGSGWKSATQGAGARAHGLRRAN
jgi:superfamily II DNA/RNA helicase